MKKISMILVLLMAAFVLNAKIEMPSIFSDNMVLQRNTDVAIFGKAKGGAKVSVKTSWNKKTVSTQAGEDGKWLVRVATPEAGGPYEITVSDGDKFVLSNVLIGEVWYCGGQSNMEMPMKGYSKQPVEGAADKILEAKAERPIRICLIQRASSRKPLEQTLGTWQENTPETVSDCSATAYFFADYVQRILDVPVGIIVDCWGGSTIETWLPREVIEKQFPGEFDKDLKYLDNGGNIKGSDKHKYASLCYNGMVNPIIPYTFKGIIWYQGCSNRSRPEQYTRLQKAYVEFMREAFKVPDAPFYFVEIAPYRYDNPDAYKSGYLREAQVKSLKVIPNSGIVSTVDAGEFATIHPRKKQIVGSRLAYLALVKTYGIKGVNVDPSLYLSSEYKDGKAYLKFKTDKLGLAPMGELTGFEIAGEDKVFKPAKASVIHHDELQIYSEDIKFPVAVRY